MVFAVHVFSLVVLFRIDLLVFLIGYYLYMLRENFILFILPQGSPNHFVLFFKLVNFTREANRQ